MAESDGAERIERALASLDALVDHLRGVERLREDIAAVVVESQRMRADNVRLSRALVLAQQGKVGGAEGLATLKAAQDKAQTYQQQVKDLLEVQTDLESRLLELEELNSSMMSMYVSSFQLHATLDLAEVLRVIEEILVNFIGARSYALLLQDDDGETFRIAASQGLDGRLPSAGIRPRGVLAETLGSLTAYVHTSSRSAREGILAAVPLAMGKTCVGAILVYSLLSQKERFLRNDVELFSLLGGHAASAVVSAKLYMKAVRKVKTLQAMLSLLEETGGDERG
ncbi:MAG: GAF domain-containing protein [Deltaproteobacteria bacterium]|nr:GAF domain-containing protein [Deltaproteobacteria bacterium]